MLGGASDGRSRLVASAAPPVIPPPLGGFQSASSLRAQGSSKPVVGSLPSVGGFASATRSGPVETSAQSFASVKGEDQSPSLSLLTKQPTTSNKKGKSRLDPSTDPSAAGYSTVREFFTASASSSKGAASSSKSSPALPRSEVKQEVIDVDLWEDSVNLELTNPVKQEEQGGSTSGSISLSAQYSSSPRPERVIKSSTHQSGHHAKTEVIVSTTTILPSLGGMSTSPLRQINHPLPKIKDETSDSRDGILKRLPAPPMRSTSAITQPSASGTKRLGMRGPLKPYGAPKDKKPRIE